MVDSCNEQLEILLAEVQTDSEALEEFLDHVAVSYDIAPDRTIVEDEVPEPPARPVTRPGDLWSLGQHRLLCGDSSKREDVARLLGQRRPFLMVTDPPYGVAYDPTRRHRRGLNNSDRTGAVLNDDRADWTEAYKLFPGRVGYVWHGGRATAEVAANLAAAGLEIRAQIIWCKPQLVIGRGHYHWQHEPCFYAARKGGSAKWRGDRKQTTLWEISGRCGLFGESLEDAATRHGTQKPVECMARPIRHHGFQRDDVYDPFAGSGSTLVAAEQLGRGCQACELSPAYCDVVVERWQNLTGGKAKRAGRRKSPGAKKCA